MDSFTLKLKSSQSCLDNRQGVPAAFLYVLQDGQVRIKMNKRLVKVAYLCTLRYRDSVASSVDHREKCGFSGSICSDQSQLLPGTYRKGKLRKQELCIVFYSHVLALNNCAAMLLARQL